MAFDRLKQENPQDPRPYLYSGIALIKAGRKKDAGVELNQAAVLKPTDARLALALARALIDLGRLELASNVFIPWQDSPDLPAEALWLWADLYYRQKFPNEALAVLQTFAKRHPDDERIDLRRGEIFLMGRNAEQALLSFQKAVKMQPNRASAYYGLGRAWQLKEGLRTAREFAGRAVELEPDNPAYLQLLGTICDALGESEEAIRHLERAAQSPAASSKIYFDLGNAYKKAGDVTKASHSLRRYQQLYSVEESQRNRELTLLNLLNQALKQLEQGNSQQAESSLKRILEIDADHWLAHLNLTQIYLIQGNDQLAHGHLQKMQQLDPESSEGHYFTAFYWYEREDYAQALTYAEKAKMLRPGQPDLRNLLGNIYFALGQREKALPEYLAAVNLAPDRFDFRANYQSLVRKLTPEDWAKLGFLYFDLRRFNDAIQAFQSSLARDSNQPQVHKALGRVCLLTEQHDLAESAFLRAKELGPRDFEPPYLLGRLYQKLKRLPEAAQSLEDAARLNPGFVRALSFLGSVYSALGKNSEADQALRNAVETNAGSPSPDFVPYLEYGIFLQRIGRLEESIQELQKAVKLNPPTVEAHFELSRSLYRVKRLAEARKYLTQALGRGDDPRLHYLLGRICYEQGDVQCGERHLALSERYRK